MVAFLKPEAAPVGLPLLLEPDRPQKRKAIDTGWQRKGDRLIRNHSDDAHGAFVQHCVIRYLVHGVQRQTISQETGYSPRQLQAWISGDALYTYAEPVRRALRDMGISIGRGAISETGGKRACEVVQACMALLADVQRYVGDDWPRERELKELSRLLTAGREPLGPVS